MPCTPRSSTRPVSTGPRPERETKVVLAGFYLPECSDLDEAIRWASDIPAAWERGAVDVRPIIEM